MPSHNYIAQLAIKNDGDRALQERQNRSRINTRETLFTESEYFGLRWALNDGLED